MRYFVTSIMTFMSCTLLAKVPAKTPEKAPTVEAKDNDLVKSVAKTPLSLDELRKIQSQLQNYQTLSLDFNQTVYKKLRDKTLANKGDVYFKKPQSFRWSFNNPQREEWIYDGDSLLHYFPKKAYAHRYKAYAAKGKNLREIVSMVLDFDSLLQRYNVSSAFQRGKLVELSLAPKAKGEIEGVELILDLDKNFIQSVKLNFEGGNYSFFAFSNPRYVASQQGFSIPAQVKVSDAI